MRTLEASKGGNRLFNPRPTLDLLRSDREKQDTYSIRQREMDVQHDQRLHAKRLRAFKYATQTEEITLADMLDPEVMELTARYA